MKKLILCLVLCSTLSAQSIELMDSIKGQTNLGDENFLIRGFSLVDRSVFLPNQYKEMSEYLLDFPLRKGICALSPLTLINIFIKTELNENDKILIVGEESSYVATALSQAGMTVYIIDPTARASSGYELKKSANMNSWISMAPFDYILVTNIKEEIPNQLINQLAARGTLIIPLVSEDLLQCWFKVETEVGGFNLSMLGSASIFPLF